MLATLLGPPEVVVGVEPPQAANTVAATSPSTGIRAFIANLPIAALLRMSRIVVRWNFERLAAAYASSPLLVSMNLSRLAPAALALRWLSTHVESAVGLIRDVVRAASSMLPAPAPSVVPAFAAPDMAWLISPVAGSSLAKRGPPTSLRISL